MLKVLDLFSGIGGFSLGLERTGGFKTVAFCEIEDYPRKVLSKHWPGVPIYEDVRELTAERLRADGIVPDVITGGFPCQDISVAGKRAGINAERSGLWSECARLLGEVRPDYAIFENVTALLSGDSGKWFQRVLWDISQVGYDAEWHCISASELGAHHHRDRAWIICHAQELQRNGGIDYRENSKCKVPELRDSDCKTNMANTIGHGLQGQRENWRITGQARLFSRTRWNEIKDLSKTPDDWAIEPDVGRVANGIPKRVDRLKGLGNAVVPQIPELIGRAILEEINCQS